MTECTKKYNFSGKVYVSNSNNPRNLYLHQREAIETLKKMGKKEKFSSLLVIPTGGGKTFTAVYWALKEIINNNQKILWLAHRHELLNQTLKTAINTSYKDILPNRENFSYRIISGSNEHDIPVNIDKDDDFIIASKDSLNHNLEYLENWLVNNKDNVCLVIDEAHHATAKTYRRIIDLLKSICKNKFKILGLTATPMRTNQKEEGLLGKIFTDGICYSVDLKTLINNSILSTPEFIELETKYKVDRELTSYELQAVKNFKNIPDDIASDIALNKERNNYIVNHYINNKEKYGKCLVFALNVNHAITLSALFNQKGIKSDYVVSSIKDAYTGVTISNQENEIKISNFRNGKLDVLINVNILTEGTDIPDVETVFLTRPTTSSILMNQMIGRGLRGKSAGGTEKAYIVSFIDDWKDRINWISPKNLIIGNEFEDSKKETKKLCTRTVSIKMIEEFAKFMDSSIENKWKDKNYMSLVPVGSYTFNIFDEENEMDKICEVLVFEHLKDPYEQLIENMEYIFKNNGILDEKVSDKEFNSLYNYIEKEIFDGYDLEIGFNEEDIKDLLFYYNLTGEKPVYVPFEGRDDFNIGKLASEIVNNEFNRIQEFNYINKKWEDEKLGWKIYFNNDISLFKSEIDREIRNMLLNKDASKPEVKANPIDYEKMPLYKIKELDIKEWRRITDAVYEKFKNKNGEYESASGTYSSKNKRYFQIDHIVPLSKGGKTVVENLQLLTRWENAQKGDSLEYEFKPMYEIEELDLETQLEAAFDLYVNYDYDSALEIIDRALDEDENCISALNLKAKVNLDIGKYHMAKILCNKVLKIDPNNINALHTKAHTYKGEEKFEKAIDIYTYILENIEVSKYTNMYIGECYYRLKKYNLALEEFEKALEFNKDDYKLLAALGWMYAMKRKYNKSIEYCKKALEINPESGHIAYKIAENYTKLEEFEKAKKYYKESQRLFDKEEY